MGCVLSNQVLHILTFFLAFIPVQEEQVDSAADRLSPKNLKKQLAETYKIGVPRILDDKDLVKEPQELLNSVRDMQQKAWEARKGKSLDEFHWAQGKD